MFNPNYVDFRSRNYLTSSTYDIIKIVKKKKIFFFEIF